MSDLPYILHVDDEPDTLAPWVDLVNATNRVELEARHPQDVTLDLLERASLVLVDLKLKHWPEREAASFVLRMPNGIALVSSLQQIVAEASTDRARSFALYTSHKSDIAGALLDRAHVIARAHNLEWVFDKSHIDADAPQRTAGRVCELALATAALKRPWPADSPDGAPNALKEWLRLPADALWTDAAWRSVMRCRPPLHGFAAYTHGAGILRWMLHKILPYPCFLVDVVQLAARLHVTPKSLVGALAKDSELTKRLDIAHYRGALATFDGPRWWRSAVDDLMFELSQDSANGTAVQALKEMDPTLEVLPWEAAFPVLRASDLKQSGLASNAKVVEIVPDDWPPYADQAWAIRDEVARNEQLRALVADFEVI